jgi:hypothetical protein
MPEKIIEESARAEAVSVEASPEQVVAAEAVIEEFGKLESDPVPEVQVDPMETPEPPAPRVPPAPFSVQPVKDIDGYSVRFTELGSNPPVELTATIVTRIIRLDTGECISTEHAGSVTITDSEFRTFPHFDELREFVRASIVAKL